MPYITKQTAFEKPAFKLEEEIKKQTEFDLQHTEMKNAGLANDEIRRQLKETTKHL